jgi:hypothetical protein
MLKDLGLDPSWDSHGFSDQEEGGCECGKENCETEAVNSTQTKNSPAFV